MKTIIKIILLSITLFSCSYLPENTDYMDNIEFEETTEYITMRPANEETKAVFMFLPGGLVDPHAYIVPMNSVVKRGIAVVILKFSANLAILESSKPKSIMNEMPEVKNWYIGGHSLGGITSQMMVKDEPNLFKGLVFLGVYPSADNSIASWDKNVLSLYASNDGLSTVEKIEANRSYLPEAYELSSPSEIDTLQFDSPKTLYNKIEGGNHSQFGDYGFQEGDGAATISKEEQHELIGESISNFILWSENN